MKVCMLAERLPPEFTGSGRQAVFLGKALIGRNVDVVGLCSNPNGQSDKDMTWGFPIFRLHTSSTERLRSLQFAVKSTIWLLKHRREYDILHVHGYCNGGLVGSIVAKALGKRTIYKITLPGEDDPEALYQSRLGMLKLFLLKQFDGFVSISNRVQRRLDGFAPKDTRTLIIPNGIDERFYLDKSADKIAREKLIKRHQLNENVRIISSVSSIEYRKGIDVLARAWLGIIVEVPESKLFLVGPFFEKTSFHRQLLSLLGEHFCKTVFLTGNVSEPEDYYRASDVFVFPSRNESFGNALVEAMACGKACVATRIEGLTEDILSDGHNGLIVEQENHEALTRSILSVLSDQTLSDTLGENAVRTVRERFEMEEIAKKYEHFYRSLLMRDGDLCKS